MDKPEDAEYNRACKWLMKTAKARGFIALYAMKDGNIGMGEYAGKGFTPLQDKVFCFVSDQLANLLSEIGDEGETIDFSYDEPDH